MKGILTDEQIDHVLETQTVGRIGCYFDKKVYVVPITYVYNNGYIYAHSQEGMKVRMMRKNPHVCFESDTIENMANWRSVIAWGNFEELKTEREQKAAMKILVDRLLPLVNSTSIKPMQNFDHPPLEVRKVPKAGMYRIKLTEKTGRYEKPFDL